MKNTTSRFEALPDYLRLGIHGWEQNPHLFWTSDTRPDARSEEGIPALVGMCYKYEHKEGLARLRHRLLLFGLHLIRQLLAETQGGRDEKVEKLNRYLHVGKKLEQLATQLTLGAFFLVDVSARGFKELSDAIVEQIRRQPGFLPLAARLEPLVLKVLVAGLRPSRLPAEQYLDGVMKARNMFLQGVVAGAAVPSPEESGEGVYAAVDATQSETNSDEMHFNTSSLLVSAAPTQLGDDSMIASAARVSSNGCPEIGSFSSPCPGLPFAPLPNSLPDSDCHLPLSVPLYGWHGSNELILDPQTWAGSFLPQPSDIFLRPLPDSV